MDVSDASKKLTDTLKEAKEKSKATYDDLASHAGCNADMIKNIFAGKISCSNFLIICDIFKQLSISLDEFAEIPLRVDTRSHVDSIAFTATLDAMKEMNARIDAARKDSINMLQHSVENFQTALVEARQRWEIREKKLNTKNLIMSIIIYALIAIIMLFIIIDFLNPTVGWWRGKISDAATHLIRIVRRG